MLFLIISISLFFIGLIIFIFGYIGKYELIKEGYIETSNLSKFTKEKEEISLKIDEADKVLRELNKFSTYISKELESKHKELLFLYQLIDEKQESLKKSEVKNENNVLKEEKKRIVEELKPVEITTTTQHDNILKTCQTIQEKVQFLYRTGKSIDEIARTLNKGKNEIRLMIDMGKKE